MSEERMALIGRDGDGNEHDLGFITLNDGLKIPMQRAVGPEGGPVPVTGTVQLSGSTVEDYNGGKAVRTKMVALAFETWRMANGSTTIEVTAGSSVQEPTEKLVNGFGTLTCIAREVGGQHLRDGKVYVSARWMPAPGATTRSAYEKMAEFQSGATAVGALSTKAAYVRGTIWNADVMDVVLTVDFMLRA